MCEERSPKFRAPDSACLNLLRYLQLQHPLQLFLHPHGLKSKKKIPKAGDWCGRTTAGAKAVTYGIYVLSQPPFRAGF